MRHPAQECRAVWAAIVDLVYSGLLDGEGVKFFHDPRVNRDLDSILDK